MLSGKVLLVGLVWIHRWPGSRCSMDMSALGLTLHILIEAVHASNGATDSHRQGSERLFQILKDAMLCTPSL